MRVIEIISVWKGVSFSSPKTFDGCRRPFISTCGGWPTEKFRSLMFSETLSICSIKGGRSKYLMCGRSAPAGLGGASKKVRSLKAGDGALPPTDKLIVAE